VPSITLSRLAAALNGVLTELHGDELSPQGVRLLRSMLVSQGFDVIRPIRVEALRDRKSFRLTQEDEPAGHGEG
jgi:hypothetical protein